MTIRTVILILIAAVALTLLFWVPLWQGGGLIGGDLYPYFFPQKTVYADQLAEGQLPLWNRLVGFGYPLLAESQTGVLYPPNPLLYRLLSVNAAYNVSQIAHYVLAFVFTWLLMRRLDLSAWGATLASVVFVYGWFPPRICLEWAVIGGVYLPLCLWCTESYLQSRRRGWLVVLAAALGVHLLAGHFNLAFITQLTVLGYAVFRSIFTGRARFMGGRGSRRAEGVGQIPAAVAQRELRPPKLILPVTLAIAGGFALAAVQLLPTWELKQLSQREEVGTHHDPGYGHIPPWYLSQIVAPWLWYTSDSDPDQALNAIKVLSINSATNKVEAHLYFGMIPLLLICYRLFLAVWGSEPLDRRHLILLLMGLVAMIYSTGWLLPVTRHLPGFSFFMGPGRYGIVTTLAAALFAGSGLDRLISRGRATLPRSRDKGSVTRKSRLGGSLALPCQLLAVVAIGLTLADLYWVSRRVTYAVMVPHPPVEFRHQSVVRKILSDYQNAGKQLHPVRMWAPGANVATLTGFPATPVYLGLGPAVYFDPNFTMPEPKPDASPGDRAAAIARQKEWLRDASVTHILRMEPLDASEWPEAKLVWEGFDPLLNPAWGRFQQPLFLYEFSDSAPFVRLNGGLTDGAQVTGITHESVTIEADVTSPDSTLTVAVLNYPGWSVAINGQAKSSTTDGEFLSVDVPTGEHRIEWRYSPQSVWWGGAISLLAWCGLIAVAAQGAWRRRSQSVRHSQKRGQAPFPEAN